MMSAPAASADLAPRLLMYANDAYGLGHLRRGIAIAGHLARAIPGLNTLLVTGSPAAHHFTLPPGVDYVKLPSIIKTGEDQYCARDLDLPLEAVLGLRAALIAEISARFAPDVVLVDHLPLGIRGELLPALRHLRQAAPWTRLVMGLRDIVDGAPDSAPQMDRGRRVRRHGRVLRPGAGLRAGRHFRSRAGLRLSPVTGRAHTLLRLYPA